MRQTAECSSTFIVPIMSVVTHNYLLLYSLSTYPLHVVVFIDQGETSSNVQTCVKWNYCNSGNTTSHFHPFFS